MQFLPVSEDDLDAVHAGIRPRNRKERELKQAAQVRIQDRREERASTMQRERERAEMNARRQAALGKKADVGGSTPDRG